MGGSGRTGWRCRQGGGRWCAKGVVVGRTRRAEQESGGREGGESTTGCVWVVAVAGRGRLVEGGGGGVGGRDSSCVLASLACVVRTGRRRRLRPSLVWYGLAVWQRGGGGHTGASVSGEFGSAISRMQGSAEGNWLFHGQASIVTPVRPIPVYEARVGNRPARPANQMCAQRRSHPARCLLQCARREG